MNQHQVLTGACNPGENCYASGSVEGIHFTAYAAGCNIAILAGNFERVQIIPGVAHGNIKVTCIDCSTDTGKIAASYGKKVYIFEPTPVTSDSAHKLDYRWYKTAEIEAECYVNSLSWNMEGTRLLTGGELIQIWQLVPKNKLAAGDGEGDDGTPRRVHFQLGESGTGADGDDDVVNQRISHAIDPQHHDIIQDPGIWECVWKCKPATPVYHLQFSPDGFLFASAGKADRLVKIWFEDLKVQHGLVRMDSLSPRRDVLHYSFVYIAHPRAVTGFEWRNTSKYMPRGAVANMLVTSCMDNVSRIWVETILPDDGLVDTDQFDPSVSQDPKQTHRHKKRFVQRLKTIRHAIHKRRKPKYGPETVMSSANLTSMNSVHDFHRFAVHHNGVSPVLHFHLAGSINPDTDLPLLPLAGNPDAAHNFRLHWLNNKELQFTMEAEKLLQELHSKLLNDESLTHSSDVTPTGAADEDHSEEDGDIDADLEELTIKETGGKKKKSKKSSKKGKAEKLGQHSESQASMGSYEGQSSAEINFDLSLNKPSLLERLDRNIELLLKEWQSSSDMLFSIHPVDGSFLVWLVEWLDESSTASFRQAQVSFSSRLPKAFPIPDASTMACNLLLYCNYSRMDIKSAMKMSEEDRGEGHRASSSQSSPAAGVVPDNMLIPNVLLVSKHHNGTLNQWQVSFTETSKFQTVVSVAHAACVCGHRFRANAAVCHPVLPLLLTTSHHNLPDPAASPESETTPEEEEDNKSRTAAAGSFSFCSELILWQVNHVGPLSKSGGLVELARINSPDINAFTSMAWVPTLLPSTSLGSYSYSPSALFVASDGSSLRLYQAVIDARLLLTESKTSRKQSFGASFSSASSSAVPEPPSCLKEMFNLISLQSSARPGCLLELETINDAVADWQNIQLLHVFQEPLVVDCRSHNKAQSSLGTSGFGDTMSAYVDLSGMSNFEENFYLVVLERLSSKMGDEGSRLHMWKVTASSQPTQTSSQQQDTKGFNGRCRDGDDGLHDYDSDEEAALMFEASQNPQMPTMPAMRMSITTVKVCTQTLSMPTGVSVISANVAAGHLSSASIYPACFAPYLLATACSDGQVRFWKCSVQDMEPQMRHDNSFNVTSYDFSIGNVGPGIQPAVTSSQVWKPQEHDYWWAEWQMMCSSNRTSAISIPGKPITVSCAYSGRVAVAYRQGDVRAQPDHPEEKFINLFVAIYECESTGGGEWVLEDTIKLENIKIPDPQAEIELNQVLPAQPALPPGMSIFTDPFSGLSSSPSSLSTSSMSRTRSVPSLSTLQSVRKSIAEQGNKLGLLKQKCLVQLDWVSTEDGSHMLTIGVGTKILAFCQVSAEVAQSNIKANTARAAGRAGRDTIKKPDVFPHRPAGLLQKSKSLAVDDYEEDIRWMKIRIVELETADGLPPLPMHTSWVRGGILVVGMDNEFHVYTQWRGGSSTSSSSSTAGVESAEGQELMMDKRTLTEANLASLATSSAMSKSYKSMSNFKSSLSMAGAKNTTASSKREVSKKSGSQDEKSSSLSRSDSTTSLSVVHDFGLFEAARMANPVLPQYHPEQLKALLSFGKIRRVKAILAHLLRSIIGSDNMQAVFSDDADSKEASPRPRTKSVSAPEDQIDGITTSGTEDTTFEFKENTSIPPLPIYALMAADADNSAANMEIVGTTETTNQPQDYTELFTLPPEEILDLDLDDDSGVKKKKRLHSGGNNMPVSPYAFTPAHAKVLSKQLMRISVPGLNSLDQMYLVAMADTVAHCKMDFADCFSESKEGSLANDSQVSVTNQATGEQESDLQCKDKAADKNEENVDGSVSEQGKEKKGDDEEDAKEPIFTLPNVFESMDDCGLRFVLAMRQHIYLLSTLPLVNRQPLQRQGLRTYSMVWAFHSEANEELLSMIPCIQKGEPVWEELRQFGVGWWLNNNRLLRELIERVAKSAYQKNKDPMDAAIFYLAMRKKNVLWGLFRSVSNKQKADFFKKDFTHDDMRRIAKKNAFHLMGKQKFMDSAALFLLAGSLHDALMVILDKLNDFQLALVVCRLYETDDGLPESVRKLLYTNILGMDENGENYSPNQVNHDPFLRSMAFWMLKDYQAALNTLLEDKVGHRRGNKDDPDAMSTKPNIFSFYNYLRTHPLLLRLRLASTSLKQRRAILTGFTRANSVAVSDKITTIDRVTWRERQLFFATATAHLKNGCPMLALEVMMRLPPCLDSDKDPDSGPRTPQNEKSISTGTLDQDPASSKDTKEEKAADVDWSTPLAGNSIGSQKAEDFDWNTPVTSHNRADAFDWSTPLSNENTADAFDWSAPVTNKVRFDDELELDLNLGGDSDDEGPVTKGKSKVMFDVSGPDVDDEEEASRNGSREQPQPESEKQDHKVDIMAQQYKYIACLKVLMEELSTLATGFEVDGGQLRYQLYVWLEKEVEVLKVLCNYGLPEEVNAAPEDLDNGHDSDDEMGGVGGRQRTLSGRSNTSRASLHEHILADKFDLDFKERRLSKRKRWLKQHQHLLRTLASYCILQGSSGGGLASVYMELLLLLQELQQERAKQQLKSPLPFPTTLPLLTASLASSRTVIADPIQYLQRMTQDLLQSVTTFVSPPSSTSAMQQVISMRNLAVSLSACIYQCLCDSDSFHVNLSRATEPGQESFLGGICQQPNSNLMAGIIRQRSRSETSADESINTAPSKWPGVTSLQCLLLSAKDEDAPKLHVLLCEALMAVYVSLLINGLAMFETQIIYRLLTNKLDIKSWGILFGGGCRTALKVEKNIPKLSSDPMSKQRLKFNMKVMGPPKEASKERVQRDKDGPIKETYKEKFVAPELSMFTYFMTKPTKTSTKSVIDYDSDAPVESDNESDDDAETDFDEMETVRPNTLNLAGQQEHCDPNSYSWCLMRYSIMRTVLTNLRTFLPQVGIELSELPIVSPMLHAVIRLLERWEAMMQARLELFSGPPDNYIPGLTVEAVSGKPASKLESLQNAENSPFVNSPVTLPVKRLWFYLLHQENLQDIFLRYVYRRPHKHLSSDDDSMRTGSSDDPKLQDPMKIVHKEQDIITSFAINQANKSLMALATQNKLIELDVGLLLHPPSWLNDDNEYDIEVLKNDKIPTRQEQIGQGENWLVVDVKSRKLNSKWNITEEVKVAPFRSSLRERRCSSVGMIPVMPRQRKFSAVCTCSGDIVVTRPMNNVTETMPEFLVVHTPQDTPHPHSGSQTPNTPYLPSPAGSTQGLQTGRGTSVVKSLSNMGIQNPAMSHSILDRSHRLIHSSIQRALQGVRKIGSHPSLQYYLTGSADGCVRLWEWDHRQPVTTLRQPGTFPKVTKVLFNAQGNKCCVSDVEGSICLWQVGLGSNFNKPIMSLSCHNKTTSDFTFVGCSSLIATAGHSSESKNVCLWDTLLPPRSALVHAFPCHEHGSPAVVYAPQSQTLISGGRRGEICQFDIRQRRLKNTFQAHESAVKCLAVDGQEEYFVTGSAEGDIKVWALNSNQLCFSFPGEHSKNTFFRSVGSTSGVTQVAIDNSSHLFSCGADGSIKFRQLPEKELMVHHFI